MNADTLERVRVRVERMQRVVNDANRDNAEKSKRVLIAVLRDTLNILDPPCDRSKEEA